MVAPGRGFAAPCGSKQAQEDGSGDIPCSAGKEPVPPYGMTSELWKANLAVPFSKKEETH